MSKNRQAELQERLDKLTEILGGIVAHADEQSLTRCPYRNKDDECTAKFGCQNKRKKMVGDEKRFSCAADGKLDYRTAWESDPEAVEEARNALGMNGEPRGQRTVFDLADELERQVPTSCGRGGICHECIVEVHDGMNALTPRTEAERFLQGDFRLACQAVIEYPDREIDFSLLRRKPQILTQGRARETRLDPVVTRRGDEVLYNGVHIDEFRGHVYGLAIDLGTTTVVMEVVDLETGDVVQTSAFENPQRIGGSDIMNRISYDIKNPGELWKTITNTINYEIECLSEAFGFSSREIYELVVVGNSTMRDMFFRLDVEGIGQKPYKSVTEHEMTDGRRESTALTASSRRLGIKINRHARTYSPPLIASHVGSDVAAGLGAVDFGDDDRTVMFVDVGTNTEVVIHHKGRTLTASCPAGPAFEGGLVRFGMPGCDGAIDSIRYTSDGFEYTTIGDVEPQGLCGSGLIDLLAELRRHDQMSPKGVFRDRKQREMTVIPERGITFSREDASNLAQAKAANYCGQFILMRHLGLSADDIDTMYLAGGFANFVDVENAIEIGFLPDVPLERIEKIGNAAIQGAREILISRQRREMASELVGKIEHIELETTPDFFNIFVEACQLKPMPDPSAPATNGRT
jgi:uncharacterized 2Fe-2S/4Fe-4S cluster protein (DUF4445 family)